MAALASIKYIANTPNVNSEIYNKRYNRFFEVYIKKSKKGSLKAIDAAVIFLFPAKPFTFNMEKFDVPIKLVKSL